MVTSSTALALPGTQSTLSGVKQGLLSKMATVLLTNPALATYAGSPWISSQDFLDYFTARVQLHHSIVKEPLVTTLFEHAFRDACIAAGWSAVLAPQMTNVGYDITVNGQNFSLKSESHREIDPRWIRITKIRECATLKGKNSAIDFYNFVQTQMVPSLRLYQDIIVLQSYSPERVAKLASQTPAPKRKRIFVGWPDVAVSDAESALNKRVYSLISVPSAVIQSIAQIPASGYDIRGNGRAYLRIHSPAGNRMFTLYFDGSDDKVQVLGLDASLGRIHARWSIET